MISNDIIIPEACLSAEEVRHRHRSGELSEGEYIDDTQLRLELVNNRIYISDVIWEIRVDDDVVYVDQHLEEEFRRYIDCVSDVSVYERDEHSMCVPLDEVGPMSLKPLSFSR